jgi:pilus assembly protein FimV
MRRLRQPVRTVNSLLRLAIRQVSAAPVLTGSMLLGLVPTVQAVTLGDISVRSTLGQRLDATVPVRLGAGESLATTCIVPGWQGSDLRAVPGARVTAPEATREGVYEVRVTSDAALYEPMYELELAVQCPGAPILVRQYVLMLDLPGAVANGAAPATATAAAPGAALPAAGALAVGTPSPTVRSRPAAGRPAGNIETGSRYRVAEGDTLSGIAARVQGRDGSLQAMADAIQAANPEAFIRGDANLIKLGSEIAIPETTAPVLPAPTAPTAASETLTTAPGPAAQAADVPAPTLPQAMDPVPQMAETAAAPAAEAALPVQAEPAIPAETRATPAAPAAVRPRPVLAESPSAGDAPAAATDEPNPAVAAGAGIVFGLLVSTLLWLRERLPGRKRPAPALAPQTGDSSSPQTTAFGTHVTPFASREAETGISVSYEPAEDDPLAAEFADDGDSGYAAPPAKPAPSAGIQSPAPSEDITSELEGMFDGESTTIRKRLNVEKTVAARILDRKADDYAAAVDASADVDFPVGDPTGEEALLPGSTVEQPRPKLAATAQLPTLEQPRPNFEATVQSPTVDLRTLAASASRDEQQAQTLLEALTLLERDYEEELTASQVLDRSAIREALGSEVDEPTQINDARIREASVRKKSG